MSSCFLLITGAVLLATYVIHVKYKLCLLHDDMSGTMQFTSLYAS